MPDVTLHHDAVEVLGPWLMNKGDELMLRAIVERLGPRATLAVSTDLKAGGIAGLPAMPRIVWPPDREDVGHTLRRRSVACGLSIVKRAVLLPAAPRPWLRGRGMVAGRDVAALLDASGFAYGDQWNVERIARRTTYFRRVRRHGTKLIMLPQALGPFDKPEVRDAARAMFDQFDLIYAREEASLQHVLACGVSPDRAAACPDISHLLDGVTPPDPDAWATRVCVVPNARMTDRTDLAVAARYLDFLVAAVGAVRRRGLEPVILLHETNDDTLLAALLDRLDDKPRVVDEDGVTTKGILGCAYANLGSRYHSLVSSLGQATPTLGTSWAHKYDELFDEYACPEWLLSPTLDDDALRQRLDAFLSEATNLGLRERLRPRAESQKAKVAAMWERVETLIGGGVAAARNGGGR